MVLVRLRGEGAGPAQRRAVSLSVSSLSLAALLWTAGCGGDDEPTEPDPPRVEAAFPANYRDAYVEVRDCRFSVPHGPFIGVHADPSSAQAYLDGEYPFEQGAILVKTLYSSETCDPASITGYAVMIKGAPGTNPDGADWIWQDVGADRFVLEQGSIRNCIGCHRSECPETDYACTEP